MNNNLYSNINGTLIPVGETNITSKDNAVRSRYGLYETILFRDGIILREELHWQRLSSGLSCLDFQVPEYYTSAFFEQQIKSLVVKNRLQELCRIRLQIFASNSNNPWQPFFYIESMLVDEVITRFNEKGLHIGLLADFQKEITICSSCKVSHNNHFLLAQNAMQSGSLDDVLLLNTNGNIIESAIANVFWIKDKMIHTPPLSEGCIAGTMRHWLIAQLVQNGYSVHEKEMKLEDLSTADELFLTNSIRPIRWVERVGNQRFGNEYVKELYHRLF